MELPRLEPLWQKYRNQGLRVVAVEARRDREGALEFIQENELTYHLLENLEGEGEAVSAMIGAFGFPTSLLVDRDGKIVFCHIGFEEGDEAKLEEQIRKLLEA